MRCVRTHWYFLYMKCSVTCRLPKRSPCPPRPRPPHPQPVPVHAPDAIAQCARAWRKVCTVTVRACDIELPLFAAIAAAKKKQANRWNVPHPPRLEDGSAH